jgi:hypothetical protein
MAAGANVFLKQNKTKKAQADNNTVAIFNHMTVFLKGNCDTLVTHSGAKRIMCVHDPPSRCKKRTLRSAAQFFCPHESDIHYSSTF